MMEEEAPIEPERPIIDPHLHFWDIRHWGARALEMQLFLFDQVQACIAASGHAITHSVFVECHTMYRTDGPEDLRSLGETEFANGMAAMCDSGLYGPARLCHRIVGSADLCKGDAARPILEAHLAAAGERFRGIRMNTVYSPETLFGQPCDPALDRILRDPAFRAGARVLSDMDLSLDVWCTHGQIGDVAALADALPDLTIVLDHVGSPVMHGRNADRQDEVFAEWARAITDLARRPNMMIKLGGMGMDINGPMGAQAGHATSEELAETWRTRVECCIAAFSPARAMFESNFPPDRAAGTYGAIWNAFKRLAAGCSEDEKDMLFRGTAARTYRISLP
ncbi:amidohydrolase family protein [Novosphingobium album (ex Hu et al. 2023)]|uniref:Amidohydrolase family protein n=1 Tax=Novosphingobium album (ex Hu et al. 2023) TaxID=2930093 RepID=A0ABT0B2U2_9SPHN|nr:amidohydrolase family protein [Novosphingobium album (ex Hu et al. 2023)]MCJ2179363.1 amidohydrolase family protein [Novosphingobium album (ex Hu et al. 2023)]